MGYSHIADYTDLFRESIGLVLLCVTVQINLASSYVRLQPVVATCIRPSKPSEEAALVGAVGPCLDFAYADRHIHAAVVAGVNSRDGDLSRSDIDILVALDLFHCDLARKHANTQACSSRNLDLNLEVVVAMLEMNAPDRQFAAIRRG